VSGREPGSERREHLSELDPELRDRVLRLDEPVAWDDWDDVIARRSSASRRTRRRRTGIGLAFAAAVLAATAATLVAVHLGGSGSGPAAERADLAAFDLGVPPILPPQAIAAQTRIITSFRSSTGTHTLYVSPTTEGGFCYQWTGAGMGGCSTLGKSPLDVSWNTGRVVGVVSSLAVSTVRIRFTDGTSAEPRIAWVSAPIDAGFIFYEIPAGKTVAGVTAYDEGRTQGQVTWYSV
jgi:hypothetical protein